LRPPTPNCSPSPNPRRAGPQMPGRGDDLAQRAGTVRSVLGVPQNCEGSSTPRMRRL
jgi:hypothetical protein